eukprot:GHVN01101942.1.p5 GENE.GHVN01101942.1~~GHVN01101942.1.p5  ORF type:complete len:335 (-),score=64.06 GHVN01101942.1:7622-8626(-)
MEVAREEQKKETGANVEKKETFRLKELLGLKEKLFQIHSDVVIKKEKEAGSVPNERPLIGTVTSDKATRKGKEKDVSGEVKEEYKESIEETQKQAEDVKQGEDKNETPLCAINDKKQERIEEPMLMDEHIVEMEIYFFTLFSGFDFARIVNGNMNRLLNWKKEAKQLYFKNKERFISRRIMAKQVLKRDIAEMKVYFDYETMFFIGKIRDQLDVEYNEVQKKVQAFITCLPNQTPKRNSQGDVPEKKKKKWFIKGMLRRILQRLSFFLRRLLQKDIRKMRKPLLKKLSDKKPREGEKSEMIDEMIMTYLLSYKTVSFSEDVGEDVRDYVSLGAG